MYTLWILIFPPRCSWDCKKGKALPYCVSDFSSGLLFRCGPEKNSLMTCDREHFQLGLRWCGEGVDDFFVRFLRNLKNLWRAGSPLPWGQVAGDLLADPCGSPRGYRPLFQGEVSWRVFWFDCKVTVWVGWGQVTLRQVCCCCKGGVRNMEGQRFGRLVVGKP